MNRRCGGFTLLELLVAVALFAVVSTIAYGGLNALIRQYEQSDAQVARTASMQRAMALLASDLVQMQPRSVREEFHGERTPALVAGPRYLHALEFTRGGWSNPASHRRATLQRVAWRLQDDRLERLHWQVLDRAPLTEPVVTPLLQGVTRLDIRFLDLQGDWQDSWPSIRQFEPDPDGLPAAIEVSLQFENGGTLIRVFATGAR